ncbi:MAG: hypothetical protein J6O53_01635 [Eubacterium sp.]|nr:hypothetical protein [Eubacterium sp.]
MKEIRVLARLELINLFGLNTYRYTKDPKEKRKKLALLIALGLVGVVLMGYAGGTAYALADFGLADKIPMVYVLLTFVLQLGLGAMKAKSLIYRETDLELLTALPIRGTHVAAARMLRLYVDGLIITLLVMLPGMIICGIYTGAGAFFYVGILPVILILPILPVAVSAWVGILFAAIIARFRHKVLAEVLLVVLLMVGMLVLSAAFSANTMTAGSEDKGSNLSSMPTTERIAEQSTKQSAEALTEAMTEELSEEEKEAERQAENERIKAKLSAAAKDTLQGLESACPPARILGEGVLKTDLVILLTYLLISLLIFGITAFILGRNFFRISARLRTVTRHREYQLEALKEQSVMKALVKKEAAGYFSSGIYVANTIVGPVLAIGFSVALAFLDLSKPLADWPMIHPDAALPYMLGGFFSMLSISSCSISMEGKNWWIPRSLPLSTREILGAKALFNLILLAPVYGLMEVILLFTLRVGLADRLWLLLIPLAGIPFSVLFGLFLNLKFPKLHWENATEVVKQSAASGLSLLGGFLLILPGMGVMLLPDGYRHLLNLVMLLVIAGISWRLYRRVMEFRLEKLET